MQKILLKKNKYSLYFTSEYKISNYNLYRRAMKCVSFFCIDNTGAMLGKSL